MSEQNNNRMPRALPRYIRSSADPEKISLTIKSAAVLVPLVVNLAALRGVHIAPEKLVEFVNQVAVAAAAVATVYGAIRKLWGTEADGGKDVNERQL